MRIHQTHGRSMGLLSFIYWLITGLRLGRRQTADGAMRELARSQFREEFSDAAWLGSELRPVRAKIFKYRRR